MRNKAVFKRYEQKHQPLSKHVGVSEGKLPTEVVLKSQDWWETSTPSVPTRENIFTGSESSPEYCFVANGNFNSKCAFIPTLYRHRNPRDAALCIQSKSIMTIKWLDFGAFCYLIPHVQFQSSKLTMKTRQFSVKTENINKLILTNYQHFSLER